MTFEFRYGDTWYKYEDGHIKKQCGLDFYDYFCPVLIDLSDKIQDFSADQLKSIMEAIIHGYYHGHAAGQKHKIQEFKRIFKIID